MSGCQRQGMRLCQETFREQRCRDQTEWETEIIIYFQNSIVWGGEAELQASLQKRKKEVGGNDVGKVCIGHFGVKETEKQCLLERAVRSPEW